jgi:hypothetical protein
MRKFPLSKSALPPKADIFGAVEKSPLMTLNGHLLGKAIQEAGDEKQEGSVQDNGISASFLNSMGQKWFKDAFQMEFPEAVSFKKLKK